MSKRNATKTTRTTRRASRREAQAEDFDMYYTRQPPRAIETLEPKTEKQKKYMNCIKSHIITFATGSAGTGKTYIAASLAAMYLENRKVDRIIVTRPAVEAGESLGFLPGELDEKFDPLSSAVPHGS